MATYLLLRDNKQIGPLTLEELTQKGLKGYDLVWVEGRSAAWRYPSEIQELKSFAPIVEEQPFDRFYKRPSAEIKTGASVQKEIAEVKNEPPVSIPEKQYASISRGDNRVYVTLPSRNSVVASAPSANKNTSGQTANTGTQDAEKIIPQQRIFSEENFSKHTGFDKEFPHEDVVERKQHVEKKQQIHSSNKKNLNPVLMILGVIVLLGSGILIGLYINKNTYSPVQTISVKKAPSVSSPTQNPNASSIPVYDKLVDNSNQKSAINSQNSPAETSQAGNSVKQTESVHLSVVDGSESNVQNKKEVAGDEKNKAQQKTKNILPKKISVVPENTASVTDSDFSLKTGISHRNASHRTDEVSDKAVLKANIADLVGLTASNYTVGTFGGISNLQITISNRSVYPLDLVVVEVQYIQANKKVFKTENLYFHNINAGAALMQDAPKSPRGIKVQYKIALINSKESGISYSGN